jgi:hypothetical protein
MPELAHDERVRHLQRLAYGGVASDADRAAAAAELEALRRERDAPAAPPDIPPPAATDARTTAGPETDAVLNRATPHPTIADHAASVRRFRWAIAAGTAALFLGLGAGWQLGARSATTSTPAAAEQSVSSLEGAGLMVPVPDTSVLAVFDRAPTPADVPNGGTPDDPIAPDDYRLLLTRPDGIAVHAARVDSDENVCVTVAMPEAGTASSCTTEGMFPQDGLWVEFYVQGAGLLRGVLHVDGSATITPPGYVAGEQPIVTG